MTGKSKSTKNLVVAHGTSKTLAKGTRFAVHIGGPKTGSTSLQRALFDSCNSGVKYLPGYAWEAEPFAHHGLLEAVATDNLSGQAQLREAIRELGNEPVLISSEGFFPIDQWRTERLRTLIKILTELGPVEVIAVVREPRDWFASWFLQLLRSGAVTDSEWFAENVDYAGALATIRDLPAATGATVQVFEYSKTVNQQLLSFLGAADVLTRPANKTPRFPRYVWSAVSTLTTAPGSSPLDYDRISAALVHLDAIHRDVHKAVTGRTRLQSQDYVSGANLWTEHTAMNWQNTWQNFLMDLPDNVTWHQRQDLSRPSKPSVEFSHRPIRPGSVLLDQRHPLSERNLRVSLAASILAEYCRYQPPAQ